jgi:hypothetical protein
MDYYAYYAPATSAYEQSNAFISAVYASPGSSTTFPELATICQCLAQHASGAALPDDLRLDSLPFTLDPLLQQSGQPHAPGTLHALRQSAPSASRGPPCDNSRPHSPGPVSLCGACGFVGHSEDNCSKLAWYLNVKIFAKQHPSRAKINLDR